MSKKEVAREKFIDKLKRDLARVKFLTGMGDYLGGAVDTGSAAFKNWDAFRKDESETGAAFDRGYSGLKAAFGVK
jgi:hypothetical protein